MEGGNTTTPATPPGLLLRERQLRVLAVLPTYDPLATSGDAEYLRRVVEGLVARGAAVQVLTTYDHAPRQATPEALVWGNEMARLQPLPSPAQVERFRVSNVPGWLRGYATRVVQRARDRRRRTRGLGLGYSYLDTGFHEVEYWKGGAPFRWTGPVAFFQIDRPGGRDVVVELYAPGIANVDVIVNGKMATTIGLKREAWQKVELPFPSSGKATYELRIRPTFTPRGETRRLGVAIRSVTVRTRQAEDLPLPLDRERDTLLQPLDSFRLAEQYDLDAQGWGRGPATWDALLKGPVSLKMAWRAWRAARRCEVVLVAGTPYLTSLYGWFAARRAGKPLVAIPFSRLRDPDHHRPWLRFVNQRTEHVIGQSEPATRFVEQRWSRRATLLPGGVDAAEYSDAAIDGRRFRARHGLGDAPVVLMLAPKNRATDWPVFVAAAEVLRREGHPARFVLVGHDEDGQPLPGDVVRYVPGIPADEVRDALDACDVFVLPSPRETSISPFLRAWMRGKPVVGSGSAEVVRELVNPGEDGILLNRPEDLPDALRKLLGDPALRARMGERGRQRAAGRLTWDHVGSVVDDLLYGLGVR